MGKPSYEPATLDPVNQRRVADGTENKKHGVRKIHVGEELHAEVHKEQGVARVSPEHDARDDEEVHEETKQNDAALARINGRNSRQPFSQAR